MISVLLYGACGHMGKVVSGMAAQDPDVRIVAGVDAYGDQYADFPVYRKISDCTVEADVIIDFSTAEAVDELIAYGVERGIPMVVCTTGLSESQIRAISDASTEVAILRSGNMSLGINLIMKLLRDASKVLCANGYDPEIIEEHHRRKLDAPSGTALSLFNAVKEVRPEATANCGRSGQGKRTQDEVGIHAIRMGNIVGIHEVMISTQNERISLKHEAFSRGVFAEGSLKAAAFMVGKKPGMYDMKDMLNA